MKHSLLEIPRFREAPTEVVQNCRTISPTCELVYMDEGAWFLGSIERTTIRERAGGHKRRIAARIWHKMDVLKLHDPKRAATAAWMWWEGTLLLQGFAGIEVFRGEPDSRVENFLRQRHYQWANDLDATLRRFAAEDDHERRGDADEIAAEVAHSTLIDDHRLRDAHRHAFRKPVSFTMPQPAGVSA